MNVRNGRTVNVNRNDLLTALKQNLTVHEAEYNEALVEFKASLEQDLKLALKKVQKTTDPLALKKFNFSVQFPSDHRTQYKEVIEMLEMSVDETINLDAESFKAYFKNEWYWQESFRLAKSSYGIIGSSLSL